MRVIEAGRGRPLLFLHPFPFDADFWAAQMAALPQGWHGIAPDFRGFGRDGATETPVVSIDDYARDVLAMLDARGIERAVIASVSMGGYVAFAMQRLAPERVRALVLANTRMDADPPEGRAKREAMLDLIAREGSAGVAREMPPLLGATTMEERPEIVARVREWVAAAPDEGMAAAVRAMRDRPDSSGVAAAFTGPALVVSGAEDTLTPPPLQAAIAEAMPNATLVAIEGAGHLASLERPDIFNAALLRFLHILES